jgi:crotonobetainyl-CoA:carnitine CoA-transferase CaiB-like acyl-CoA transferase
VSGGGQRPLTGLRVIERASGVAAQYCGRLLAVMGAEVTRVEAPGGCESRRQEPLLQTPDGRRSSVLFEYLNVEKQSVCLSLGADDHAAFDRLLEGADLLIDDTPVRSRSAFGLSPERIRARHPRLVFVSVLPFGASGPLCSVPASELTLFHSAGEGFLMPNGLAIERLPDRPPVKIHGHFASMVGGASAAGAAIVAAMAQLDGIGQFVDISIQDANVAIGCFAIQRLGDGVVEQRQERSFKYGGVLECADGYVELLVLEQHQWMNLVALMGDPQWAQAYTDPLERGRRGGEINVHIRGWAKSWRVADLVRAGQAAKVPFAPYNDPVAVLNSPHNLERGVFDTAQFEAMSRQAMLIAPFRFPEQTLSAARPAPAPGAHDALISERKGS